MSLVGVRANRTTLHLSFFQGNRAPLEARPGAMELIVRFRLYTCFPAKRRAPEQHTCRLSIDWETSEVSHRKSTVASQTPLANGQESMTPLRLHVRIDSSQHPAAYATPPILHLIRASKVRVGSDLWPSVPPLPSSCTSSATRSGLTRSTRPRRSWARSWWRWSLR